MLDFSFTEEQQLIVDTVRGFAAEQVHPVARKCEERETAVPDALLQSAWELGLVYTAIPEAQGGGGQRSALTGVLVTEELAAGDLALALHVLSPNLAVLPVVDFGSDAQKAKILPRYVGERFAAGSVAIVEPRVSYGPLELQTTATKQGDRYVLKGEKCFVPVLDDTAPILVFAQEGDAVQGFFVERNAGGMKVEPEKTMGLNALNLCEVTLEDCAVPASARLGEAVGSDFRKILARSNTAIAAAAVGVARAAKDYAIRYAKEREAFGAPIATKQAIAFMLAEMAIEIDAARMLVWESAWMLDRGEDAFEVAYLARQTASDMAVQVTDNAVQVLGGHGYIREHDVELHLRNARGIYTLDGVALV